MHISQTSLLLQSSARAYRMMLHVYPGSLRSLFQQEMLSVFEDQLQSAWERSGYRGVARCWCGAVVEMLSLAFPDSLTIPALSILLGLFLTASFLAYIAPSAHCAK